MQQVRPYVCTGPRVYTIDAGQAGDARYRAGKLFREETQGELPADYYATLFRARVLSRVPYKVPEPLVTVLPYIPSLSSTDLPKLRSVILEFSPSWVPVYRPGSRQPKGRLELQENGTNKDLERWINKSGFSAVSEFPLPWGQRVDIAVLNSEILVALECKPHIRTWEQYYKLVGKIQSIKTSGTYKTVWAVVYGDVREDMYIQLESTLGKENILLKGRLLRKSARDKTVLVTSR